jgi:hypothetical protein
MMKAGTNSPVKTGLAILLGILAIFYMARWAIGSHSTQPAVHSAAPGGMEQSLSSLDPALRTDLLKDEEDTKYESKGRNIFLLTADIPPVITPVIKKDLEPIYTPPPPPPPIPLKAFGYAARPGEAKRVFLSRDQDIWVAKEGDVVDRRYRIVRINPNSVEVEDVLSNNRQSIPMSHS